MGEWCGMFGHNVRFFFPLALRFGIRSFSAAFSVGVLVLVFLNVRFIISHFSSRLHASKQLQVHRRIARILKTTQGDWTSQSDIAETNVQNKAKTQVYSDVMARSKITVNNSFRSSNPFIPKESY
jgi:arginine/ornithine N-succinyltransferase beta subunit